MVIICQFSFVRARKSETVEMNFPISIIIKFALGNITKVINPRLSIIIKFSFLKKVFNVPIPNKKGASETFSMLSAFRQEEHKNKFPYRYHTKTEKIYV